jgi:enoyl-CoA hydratase
VSTTDEYSSYTTIKVDVADQVATIYLYWPEGIRFPKPPPPPGAPAFHDEFREALFRLRNDDSVRVVILRGPGERYFLSSFAGVEDDEEKVVRPADGIFRAMVGAPQMIEQILKMAKPVIAMVNGDAIGIGSAIAMACDIIIAVEDAYITDSHIASHYWQKGIGTQDGVVAGDGGAVFWPLSMSLPLAKEFLFTGRPVTARELADLRAINYAVPRQELQATVDRCVQLLLERPAWALAWTKVAMNKQVIQNFELTMELGLALEMITIQQGQSGQDKGVTKL